MTARAISWIRFLLPVVLIASAGLFLQSRTDAEVIPPREPVYSFPIEVGEWAGTTVRLQEGIIRILGHGEFLQRVYRRSPFDPPVDLFLAYFPTQRTGSTIHSPKNCLPGAGWAPLESGRMQLRGASEKAITVNRYVIGKGAERQIVLYWYQAHGRVVASEYWAKIFLVTDSITMNRSDGALVRVGTPLGRGEELGAAEQRVTAFAQQAIPILDRYVPR